MSPKRFSNCATENIFGEFKFSLFNKRYQKIELPNDQAFLVVVQYMNVRNMFVDPRYSMKSNWFKEDWMMSFDMKLRIRDTASSILLCDVDPCYSDDREWIPECLLRCLARPERPQMTSASSPSLLYSSGSAPSPVSSCSTGHHHYHLWELQRRCLQKSTINSDFSANNNFTQHRFNHRPKLDLNPS